MARSRDTGVAGVKRLLLAAWFTGPVMAAAILAYFALRQ